MATRTEWRVLVADDEPAARRGVRQLLAAHPEFVVVGESRNGVEVLAALDVLKPDVIFLDIQMPGIDGFEVIRRRTPERMPVLVFLTAYDQFAINAFEAQALDYLVKPVTAARFSASIRRITKVLNASATNGREGTLMVATPGGAVVLRHSEIDWIESADNYSRIWVGKRSYMLRESLRALEDRVKPAGFRRRASISSLASRGFTITRRCVPRSASTAPPARPCFKAAPRTSTPAWSTSAPI